MRYTRIAAIAIATAALSLGAGPMAAHAAKPGGAPCAKEQQQVVKAQQAVDHAASSKKPKKPEIIAARQRRLAQALAALAACQATQPSS